LAKIVVTHTWDGGGANNLWTTAANWVGDVETLARGRSLSFRRARHEWIASMIIRPARFRFDSVLAAAIIFRIIPSIHNCRGAGKCCSHCDFDRLRYADHPARPGSHSNTVPQMSRHRLHCEKPSVAGIKPRKDGDASTAIDNRALWTPITTGKRGGPPSILRLLSFVRVPK